MDDDDLVVSLALASFVIDVKGGEIVVKRGEIEDIERVVSVWERL